MNEYILERINANNWEHAMNYLLHKYGSKYSKEKIKLGVEEVPGFTHVIYTTNKKTAEKYTNTIRSSVSDLLSF